MIYYAQTMPGVEEIAWLEIRERLKNAHFSRYLFAKEQNGIVVFDYPGPATDLLRLRTTEDVFAQIAYFDDLTRLRRDLRTIQEVIAVSEGVGRAVNDYLRVRRFSAPPDRHVPGTSLGSTSAVIRYNSPSFSRPPCPEKNTTPTSRCVIFPASQSRPFSIPARVASLSLSSFTSTRRNVRPPQSRNALVIASASVAANWSFMGSG